MQPPPDLKSFDTPRNSLVLIGSSARAAAFDAKLAGFHLLAVDRFGDEDLVNVCDQWIPYDNHQEWRETISTWPDGPIVPVGGFSWASLQNHRTPPSPDLRSRAVAHPSEATLTAMNTPHRLAEIAKLAGVAFPETWGCFGDKMVPITPMCKHSSGNTNRWLAKPRRHAGGVGIRSCDRTDAISQHEILQQRIPGRPIGANFIATGQTSPIKAFSLGIFGGITYRRNKSHPYLYGGSYGPLRLPEHVSNQIEVLGQTIAATFSLRGLFNVDLILAADESLWLLEVNPRYSSSMELISRRAALSAIDAKTSLIDLHLGCYQNRPTISQEIESYQETLRKHSPSTISSKRIVYAKQAILQPKTLIRSMPKDVQALLADLPNSDLQIREGEPICTVVCSGSNTLGHTLKKSAHAAHLVRATCQGHH